MLSISNIKFLSKVEGLLDRINIPQVVIRITIEDSFMFPELLGKTQMNITNWNDHLIPPVELSPYVKDYKLQFNVYREGVIIGSGITKVNYNENRKDCLDVKDKDNNNNGKLVYDLTWERQSRGKYISYEQFKGFKEGNKGQGGKPIVVPTQIKVQKVKAYVREEGSENCFCSCFAVRKKPPQANNPVEINQAESRQNRYPQHIPNDRFQKQSQPIYNQYANQKVSNSIKKSSEVVIEQDKSALLKSFRNHPVLYYQEELQEGKLNDVQMLNRLNYYSKSFVTSK